ncbi:MAG: MFS transporter [Rhizobiaceae bacterium]
MKSIQSSSRAALASGAMTHIAQDGLSATINVLLPVLAQIFGLSYAYVGLLRGVKSFVQAVVEMGSGLLSERVGETQLLAIGLVFSGLGYALISAASGLVVITAGLVVVGIGTALHHAPSSSLIASNFGADRRSSALGLYNASGDIGKLAFSGGFSFAAGLGMAWYQTSLIYAALSVLAAMAILFISSELRRKTRQTTHTEGTISTGGDGDDDDDDSFDNDGGNHEELHKVSRWGVVDWRQFSVLLSVICIDNMIQTSVLVFTAFLMLSKGFPLWQATAATVIVLTGGAAGKAACGFLADRLGVRPAFALIQILTAIGLSLIVIAPTWIALALLLPLGAVVQGSSSITYGFAANLLHPSRMARGYALLYASGSFTAAAGPPLFGLIGDWVSISATFYAMAFATLLAAPLIYLLPRPASD